MTFIESETIELKSSVVADLCWNRYSNHFLENM